MVTIRDVVKAGKSVSPALVAVSFAGIAIGLVGAVLVNLFDDVANAEEPAEEKAELKTAAQSE